MLQWIKGLYKNDGGRGGQKRGWVLHFYVRCLNFFSPLIYILIHSSLVSGLNFLQHSFQKQNDKDLYVYL